MLLKDKTKLLCVSFCLSVPVDPGVVLKVVDLPDVLLVVVVADRAPGPKYSVVVDVFFATGQRLLKKFWPMVIKVKTDTVW